VACVLCAQARLEAFQTALSELVVYKSRINVALLQVSTLQPFNMFVRRGYQQETNQVGSYSQTTSNDSQSLHAWLPTAVPPMPNCLALPLHLLLLLLCVALQAGDSAARLAAEAEDTELRYNKARLGARRPLLHGVFIFNCCNRTSDVLCCSSAVMHRTRVHVVPGNSTARHV
jgi:hypothetical protein